jgi:hypothetical protein
MPENELSNAKGYFLKYFLELHSSCVLHHEHQRNILALFKLKAHKKDARTSRNYLEIAGVSVFAAFPYTFRKEL